MKIGIYDPYLDTMSGGEKYMLSAASCLAEQHEVDIFWKKSEAEAIKTKAEMRFGYDLSQFSFVDSIFSPDVSFLSRFLASRQYDYILYLSDGSIPLLACKLLVHFQSPMQWLKTESFKTRRKVGRVNRFIVNSQFTKSFIDKKFGISSTIIYPPVGLEKTTSHKKENVILNVGRFGINHAGSSYKKQEVLLETFKNMPEKEREEWRLVLVMSVAHEDQAKLEELMEAFKDSTIEFVINPTNDVLWEQYAKAKIYWHASGFGEDLEKHPDRAEHFGISTVEAMGMGAVPIVINAGGQKEIVSNEKNGFLWSTIEELLRYTKKVMSDEALRVQLSNQAKKRAEDFSLERFCQEVAALIS